MPEPHPSSSLYAKICLLILYLLVAAAAFHGSYNKWHFAEPGIRGQSPRSSFIRMIDGTADRPYIYRQLLPATANFLDRHIPGLWLTKLFAHDGINPAYPLEALTDSSTTRNSAYIHRYLLLYSETFLFALLALYAMRQVCVDLAVAPMPASLAPAILLLLIPYFQSAGGYFYDYSELAFLALAVLATLRLPWVWLLPLAALATANKESFLLFLPALYPLLRRRYANTLAIATLALAGIVCVAVYLPIRAHFAANPGGPVEFHLRDQLGYLLDAKTLFLGTESTYGIRVLKAFSVLPLALLIWTALRGWKHLPPAIQLHAKIAAAINLPLYLLFCWPSEMRDLSLLYPTLLLLIATNLHPSRSLTQITDHGLPFTDH